MNECIIKKTKDNQVSLEKIDGEYFLEVWYPGRYETFTSSKKTDIDKYLVQLKKAGVKI